jgi:hypothetical protein
MGCGLLPPRPLRWGATAVDAGTACFGFGARVLWLHEGFSLPTGFGDAFERHDLLGDFYALTAALAAAHGGFDRLQLCAFLLMHEVSATEELHLFEPLLCTGM